MTHRLLEELKQSKPFRGPEEEAFVNLQRTADALIQALAAALKPYSLSPTQYNVLRILRGSAPNGLACGEISERMIARDPDVTRLLDRLEARALVVRTRERKDRRVITAKITAEGLELLLTVDGVVEELDRKLLGHMSESELETLNGLLDLVRKPAG